MQVQQENLKQYEFYVPDLDNLLLVENTEDGVVIRAVRNNFSERRKSFFIHQLAAEGYIPDVYQWFSNPTDDGPHSVKWVIDCSWLRIPEVVIQRARRFMIRLLVGSALLFLIAMRLVFVYGVTPVQKPGQANSSIASGASTSPAARFLEMNMPGNALK